MGTLISNGGGAGGVAGGVARKDIAVGVVGGDLSTLLLPPAAQLPQAGPTAAPRLDVLGGDM